MRLKFARTVSLLKHDEMLLDDLKLGRHLVEGFETGRLCPLVAKLGDNRMNLHKLKCDLLTGFLYFPNCFLLFHRPSRMADQLQIFQRNLWDSLRKVIRCAQLIANFQQAIKKCLPIFRARIRE
ncbi:MAG: hypothetical protein ACJAVK_001293 [Akkermansiaceae bacterium]|jgi:hypothetical protein